MKARLYLCDGKHCRKALSRDPRLRAALERMPAPVDRVRCQKICKGPVVGLAVGDDLEWFARVDSGKSVAAIEAALGGEPLAKWLRKRRNAKRAGKRRS